MTVIITDESFCLMAVISKFVIFNDLNICSKFSSCLNTLNVSYHVHINITRLLYMTLQAWLQAFNTRKAPQLIPLSKICETNSNDQMRANILESANTFLHRSQAIRSIICVKLFIFLGFFVLHPAASPQQGRAYVVQSDITFYAS